MAKFRDIDAVGQALTLAARRHRACTAILLSEIGLFPGQDQVLQLLAHQDGVTMTAIADELRIKPPTASKMIARMAAQGLLERRGIEEDARRVAVFITDEGRGRIDQLRKTAKKVEKLALADLDDKDIRRLRRLLKKVARNLGVQTPADPVNGMDIEETEAAA
jgi:MarR family transcriptional regulator, organic hydroperoxide resistance regulator